MNHRIPLILAIFGAMACATAQADNACVLNSLPVDGGGFSATVAKEAQDACSALKIDDDEHQKAEGKALVKCCKNANRFIAKNALPCSDDARMKYQVQLAIALCDKITSYGLEYEQQQCLYDAVTDISDSRIHGDGGIENKCLDEGHDDYNQAMAWQGRFADPGGDAVDSWQVEYDCEHKSLKQLVKKLDIGLVNAPVDSQACSAAKVSDEKRPKPDVPVAPAAGSTASRAGTTK